MPAAASTELMRACKHTGILATNLQYARQNKTVLLYIGCKTNVTQHVLSHALHVEAL